MFIGCLNVLYVLLLYIDSFMFHTGGDCFYDYDDEGYEDGYVAYYFFDNDCVGDFDGDYDNFGNDYGDGYEDDDEEPYRIPSFHLYMFYECLCVSALPLFYMEILFDSHR